ARAAALSYATLLALIPLLAVALGVTSSLLKREGEERIERFIEKLVHSLTPPAVVIRHQNGPQPKVIGFVESQLMLSNQPVSGAGGTRGTSADVDPGISPAPAGMAPTPPPTAAVIVDQAEVIAARKEIARRINEFIQNTRSGALGVTGTAFLIFMAISLLNRVEMTINDIWGVTRRRSWPLRIVQYWAAITLGPVLIISAVAMAGGPYFEMTKRLITAMPIVGELAFKLLPMALLWLAFALFYQLTPNTKVHWTAALVGGIVAGTLLHLNSVFGFLYVSRVVTQSKIYGSLGLVPVFMVGLYLAWLILLLGAQVAYAYQNRHGYVQDKLAESINQRGREFIALRVMTLIGQRFQTGAAPPTLTELSNALGVPARLVQQVLQPLLAAKLVVETAGAEPAFMPARALDAINCHDILLAMRAAQGQELPPRDEPVSAEVYGEFARIQEAERKAAAAVTVLALATRAQARLQLGPVTSSNPSESGTEPMKAHPAA
ncbi:MAG: YhjD/YihY/BrkB family envelope integrity protein, partial [Verrucomicrobiales bacterium]|nr:YhjD/YihY/BrkB family envelope integrity protein [Verrucomicrobiales bacterium]